MLFICVIYLNRIDTIERIHTHKCNLIWIMLQINFQIIEWNNVPMSSLTLEQIPQFIEHSNQQTIDVVFQPAASIRYVFSLKTYVTAQSCAHNEIVIKTKVI